MPWEHLPFISDFHGFQPRKLADCDLESDLGKRADPLTIPDNVLRQQCEHYLEIQVDMDHQDDDVLMQDSAISDTLLERFTETCRRANALQLMPDWLSLVQAITSERCSDVCEDDYVLNCELKWLRTNVLPWLSHVMQEPGNNSVNGCHISPISVTKIFDLIREFPTSQPVIEDLKIAIEKLDLFDDIQNALIEVLQTRLLHLGASTSDILDQYTCCIRCVKIWDPTCDILVPIIQLMEDYIQHKRLFIADGTKRHDSATKSVRKEAIRAVVGKVRDLLPNEDPIYVFELSELDGSAPSEDQEMMDDKPTRLKRWQRKSSDTVAMLISICGPIEIFVKGYEEKLREALCSSADYDTDEEIMKLEVLKQHFPKNTMIRCDVMVADINESRRLDRQIHQTVRGIPSEFHVAVLSRFYWKNPEDENEEDGDEDEYDEEHNDDASIRLWPGFQQAMDLYEAEFRRIRVSRKLQWLPSQGMTTLELQFESGVEEYRVDPVSAMVISMFENETGPKTSKQIAEAIHVQETKVLDSLELWEDKGVLSLTATGEYKLCRV
ncbi:hypothetical protein EC973_007215 [Apophysomyces ossiformis]|uniref:Cullin family profile domain-containing protein n=1 Tax=Apophysomyces ossiformis TaxID=679940 RepID=A0A8H7EUC4_9FUNG|nr:hypothetical protein EC973_007215 [Apophysomyces ossiformis]